jgi:hypothetical protein
MTETELFWFRGLELDSDFWFQVSGLALALLAVRLFLICSEPFES